LPVVNPQAQPPVPVEYTAPLGAAPAAATEEFERPGMSLTQIVTILRAYWKHSAVIFLSVLVIAAVVTKLMPKTYLATATLMVNYDVNDPLSGKEFPIGLIGSYMATQTELMLSPEVLGPVVDRLKLTEDSTYAGGVQGGPEKLHEWVESNLRKDLDIEQGHAGSQMIYIGAKAAKAELAANIANAIAEVYSDQQYQRTTGPASERAKRYTEELEGLKKKVQIAQDAVTELRKRTGAFDIDSKVDLDLDVNVSLEHRLLDTQNVLREQQAKAAGDPTGASQAQASDLVKTLRAQGVALSEKMASLRVNLGPNHPQVVQLQTEIDANARSLAGAQRSYAQMASSELNSTRAQTAEIERAIREQRQKVLASREIRDQAAKYQLELESAQSVYKRALDGYDQIMFSSRGQYTNVNFASRARPPAQPAKPKPIINMLIGAAAGLLLGLMGPFMYEMLNRRVRCRDDVERDLGLPILTEFRALPSTALPAGGAL